MQCETSQRTLSDLLDSGGDMPDQLRLHLEACPHCRAYRQRLEAVENELQGAGASAPLSAHLRDRIMRAVESSPAVATPAAPKALRLRVAAALAAAACVAAAVTFHAMRTQDPSPVIQNPPPIVNTSDWNVDDLPGPGEVVRLSLDRAGDMLTQPVEEEIRLLTEEARSAGRSLLACLPLGLGDYGRPDRRDQGTTRSAAWPTRPQ